MFNPAHLKDIQPIPKRFTLFDFGFQTDYVDVTSIFVSYMNGGGGGGGGV